MIGESRMAWLRELPMELRHDNLVLMHAGPGNLWRAPMDTADDAELEATYAQLNAEIVVYCHIHRPFIRKVGGMTVCNTGSVGLPYDGDPRSSYLLIDDDVPSSGALNMTLRKKLGGCCLQIILSRNGPRRCAGKEVTCRRRKRTSDAMGQGLLGTYCFCDDIIVENKGRSVSLI
jgi:hypothetical protein